MINRPSAAIPAPRGSGCYEFVSDHRLRIRAILLRGAPEASLCSRRLSWEQPARLHSPKRSPPSEAERETVNTRRMDPEAAGWDTEVFSEKAEAQMALLANWLEQPKGRERSVLKRILAEDFQGAGLLPDSLETVFDDGVGEDGGDPEKAALFLRRIGFPFDGGRATSVLLDTIQIIHDELFETKRSMPIPTNLLVDEQGRLAALYRGPAFRRTAVQRARCPVSATICVEAGRTRRFRDCSGISRTAQGASALGRRVCRIALYPGQPIP